MKMNNRGSTLVEITAGFLMLAVALTSFIKIIDLSSKMTKTAVDMKKESLNFAERYYTGYNYTVDGGTAFRSGDDEIIVFSEDGATVPLKLTEWHKESNGDYYDEWHQNGDKFVLSNTTGNFKISLNNIKLYHIENVRDKEISKGDIYRYKYSAATQP